MAKSETYPKLRPCPFCGSKNVNLSGNPGNGEPIAVYCHKCKTNGPEFYFDDAWADATNAWNKAVRVPANYILLSRKGTLKG